MNLNKILETCLYADDLPAAETFYTRLLGHEPLAREEGKYIFYKLDGTMLLIFDPQASADNDEVPPHGTRGSTHVCFRIEAADIPGWRYRLEELGIPLEMEHIWREGVHSLYFRDPAGNSLEIAPWSLWDALTEE
ncbi:VOC family protein [Ruficoccus sp. ZRK36]|uniref:VOC family protein n=1 Tax=Ruficoccus sp. ZRK36 TaxID=2866311 RepID=UPI001C72D400|nr:VOC family protein [Ruficoccus sp. ZRK36]QYY36434.1 VOC family protein [Ruficoccus sp. ZRK36]